MNIRCLCKLLLDDALARSQRDIADGDKLEFNKTSAVETHTGLCSSNMATVAPVLNDDSSISSQKADTVA